MKIVEFVKKECSGWENYEIFGLIFVFLLIFYHALKGDSLIAVCSAICGILYTVIAGKGKISCYFFGLAGSGCYVWLALNNHLWGNALLYLAYYIPMQVHGIFEWKKNLDKETVEIIKTRMAFKERVKFLTVGVLGCILTIFVLTYFNDKSPVIDGITTFLSILGMYFTVRRLIEQWVIWGIVNGLSFLMWFDLVLKGARAYSTLVMWAVYFVLAIYFYVVWRREDVKTIRR